MSDDDQRKPPPRVHSVGPGFSVPAGMAIGEFRRHPVYEALKGAAYRGEEPSARDLDALRLPATQRRKLEKAIKATREPRASGNFSEAWHAADTAAAEIVAALTPEQRDPDYLREPEPDDSHLTPRELADRYGRS